VKASGLNPWRSISRNDQKVSHKEEKCKQLKVRFTLSYSFLVHSHFPQALVEDKYNQNKEQGINPLTYSQWQM